MSAETPEPARFYYEVYSWSGCAGSTWERMTEAERDAWRHAERVARRLAAIQDEHDRLRADVAALADKWGRGMFADRICASELRAVLDQHPGPDDTREGA